MISVCIATYNGEKYIQEQLDSILPQLNIEDEVIISDDNSSDRTLEIILNFDDHRIKIFNNLNKGVTNNFENCLKKCSGDYVFLSDQDDIWAKNKVQVCMEDFRKGYDLILSDCSIFDSETKNILQESFFFFNSSRKGILKNIVKNSYIGCCMAFTKNVKQKAIPFPHYIPMHDVWIGIIAELYFEKINFNSDKLIYYRSHDKNISYTASGISKNSLSKKLIFRIRLIFSIIINYFKI